MPFGWLIFEEWKAGLREDVDAGVGFREDMFSLSSDCTVSGEGGVFRGMDPVG